ncbi:MAG: MATE family efflux transporter [Fusicatenibacter sp.]|nr:MATE family efflux transporter [Fusicatenibacter sp.]MDY2937174.1 MATE family efflux transporter [Fusicatenibacter sp.]
MKFLKEREGYFFSNQDLKRLILPLLIEQFLAIAVGMADSIMVSSVGEAAVSSVSLIDTIFILLINMFTAIATGGAVVCGQYIGKKRLNKACEAADQLMMITVLISVVIMGLLYLLKPFILHVVFGHITAEVEYNCNIYLMIVAASIPFLAVYNGGAAIFRAQGDSRTPMIISILMNIINIAGNAILLYGLHRGVEGAAIPTLVSRIFAAGAAFLLVYNPKYQLHCSRPIRLHFDGKMLKKILGIGIPNGLESSMFQLGKILVLSLITQFGTAAIAANAVSNSIAVFQTLPGIAIGNAILTVSAQCAGAGAYDQVKYYTKKLLTIIYGLMVISSTVVILVLPLIMRVYSLSPEATSMAEQIIVYHGICCMLIWPLAFSLPNTLRASSDVTFCMVLSILSMWICRIGFSYILGSVLKMGVFGVWVAMTLDWAVRAVFFAIRYKSGKWQHQT